MKTKNDKFGKKYLNSREVVKILCQQELKVNTFAGLIKKIPWIKEEIDTDSTIPNEKFSTPITVLTGGDFTKPAYHFMDNQKDNQGVLPNWILSIMKIHNKSKYVIEFSREFQPNTLKNKVERIGTEKNKYEIKEADLKRLF